MKHGHWPNLLEKVTRNWTGWISFAGEVYHPLKFSKCAEFAFLVADESEKEIITKFVKIQT